MSPPPGRRLLRRLGLPVGVFAHAFALLAAAPALSQPSVETLLARLESADANARREAAGELARYGSEDAVAGLNAAAADEDPRVRKAVLDALLSLRRPGAAPGLLILLEDEDRDHRRDAIRGLVEMHGLSERPGGGARAMNWLLRREHEFVPDPLRPVAPEIVAALSERLADGEKQVRQLAAEALGALRAGAGGESAAGGGGTSAAIVALGDAARLDSEADVRRDAVRALGRIGTPEAGEALLGLLRDGEATGVRAEAVRALGRMAYAPAGSPLLSVYDEDPDGDLGRDALEGLARIGFDGARGTFYHELASRDARRREFAAEGLGRLDDASLADGLVRDFLREGNERVQLALAFALVRLGQTPFVDRIVLSLDHRFLGEAARQYALELGAAIVPEYGRYLREDPHRGTRLRLVEVLERIGDDAAIPALIAASGDEDVVLADRARTAVRRIRALTGGPSEP